MHSPRFGQHSQKRAFVSDSTPSSLQTVILRPDPIHKHTGTVIFLHGLGDTAHGWVDLIETMRPRAPHVKFILPTAPNRPVTINSGMNMPAWYDIKQLSDREDDICDGIEDTNEKVAQIIEDEIKSGIPSNRILLGGFSQGGASSLHIAYTYPKPLAGVLALSSYLPSVQNFVKSFNPANKHTELLMCHGKDDTTVLHRWGKTSFDKLKSLGVNGNFISYPGLGHFANEQEIRDSVAFIQRILHPVSKL